MKTYLLLLPILFIAIVTITFPAVAQPAPDPVRDIEGNLLRTGDEYYILPVFRGFGGGLTLQAEQVNGTCVLYVVQSPSEVDNGLPLTFTPVDPKKGVIRLSTDLNIEFNAITQCITSTVWMLAPYDETTGKYFVRGGGVKGNPGLETLSNWFKIEKYEEDYKLVYCPMVCSICKVICKDIGLFNEDGVRRLALTDDEPFQVVFKKA